MKGKQKINVAYVVETGKYIGYGHLYRSIAIAESFLSEDCKVKFYNNENVETLIKSKLPKSSVSQWNHLDEEYSSYDIIIVDVYRESFVLFKDIIVKCKTHNIKSATIIDFPFRQNALNTDYVFKVGYQSYSNKKTEKMVGCERVVCYSGNDFLVFRAEFDGAKLHKPKRKANKLLVAMGGSDPSNLSELVNRSLLHIQIPLIVTFIYGNGFDNSRIGLIERENEGSHHQFHYFQNVLDMPSLIIKHDLALINGGNTRFEIAKLGVPFVSIAFQTVQKEISDLIAKDGIGMCLGLHTELRNEQIAIAIESMLNDYEARMKQSKKMLETFATNGKNKICQILLNNEGKVKDCSFDNR